MWGWLAFGVLIAAVVICVVALGLHFIFHPLIR